MLFMKRRITNIILRKNNEKKRSAFIFSTAFKSKFGFVTLTSCDIQSKCKLHQKHWTLYIYIYK
jgi:hypothetical protein